MIDSGESVWKTPASPLTTREEIRQYLGPPPWRRLAITLLAPVVYFALTRIPIPALGADALSLLASLPNYDPATTSIAALGIAPVLFAFYVVEIAALIIPRWNGLRTGGRAGRRKLLFATYPLALLFTVVQSWTVGAELAGFSENAALIPVTIACHLAVTALLIGLAVLIDRRGLGGGYAVLLGASALPVAYGLFWSCWVAVKRELLSALHVAVIVAMLGGVVAVTVYLLRLGRTKVPGLVLRVPSSGILPLGMAASLLTAFEWLNPYAASYWLTFLATSVILAIGLSYLFNRPTLVGDLVSHVTGEDREVMWGHARGQLGAVTAVTASFIGGIVLVSGFFGWLVSGALFIDVALTVVVTALILDLLAEWRFRRVVPEAIVAWPLERVYAVGPALLALERAGIPAHARSLRQRTLYQFFGPEVPIDLMVPAARAEEAEKVLASALLQKNHMA
jgi:hypothetical protein